jgi:ABC-type lipopolysaccharide export system ATPase subunit
VRGNVEEAVKPLRDALTRFEEVSAAMGEPDADFDALMAEQGELMETIEQHDGWELDARIEQAMDALRCPPGDADVTVLSGGERRRVALCRLLLEAPDLLLLDEPSAGLSPAAAQELFALIKGLHREGMTVIMVEQNALDALEIADRGYLLVDGSNAREGDARALAADAEVRHAFLGG